MPLVDRGLDMLDIGELHDQLGGKLAPLEFLPVLFMPLLAYCIYRFDLFLQFPSNIYRWIVFFDWIYAMTIGPFRWLPGNVFYDDVAYPTSEKGCKYAVFFDTFCQIGIIYTNTFLVSAIFYMVYFGQDLTQEESNRLNYMFKKWWLLITTVVCIVTVSGGVHNYVGWCTADTSLVLFKQLLWFLSMVIQITMIIPTNLIIWETYKVEAKRIKDKGEKDKNKRKVRVIGKAFYARYVGVVLTQIVGVYPSLAVEFLALARKMVPSQLMMGVILGIPAAHILDLFFLSLLVWPKATTWFLEHYEDALEANSISLDNLPCLLWLQNEDVEEEIMLEKVLIKRKKKKSCFDQFPFWLHLLMTLCIPFGLLLAFSLVMLYSKKNIIDRANLIREDIILTSLISNYIHETQKERGATGVFMGSKGNKFQCEILAQYRTTDEQKALLQHFLNTEFANVKLVTKLTFLHALIRMMGIDDNRNEVQNFDIEKGDALAWYTTQNMFFVGIVAQVCRDSHLHVNSIIHLVYSNLAFVSSKEKAGVERAKGSVAFAANGWTSDAAYRTFVELVAGQQTHLYFFETYVSVQNLGMYITTLQDPATQACNRMRAVALDANSTIMSEYEGGTWFDNMTSKINLIRQVESILAGQLTAESENVVGSTTEGMILVIGLLVVVLIIDAMMVLGLVRTNENLKVAGIGQRGTRRYRHEDSCCWQYYIQIQNLSFVQQVLVPVLLCGLVLIVIAWMLLNEQVDEAQLAASTWENMNLSFFMSNFIHETQKERGATGVFMGSAGTRFRNKLTAQKRLCDEHRAAIFEFMNLEYIDYDNLLEHSAVVFWITQANNLDDHRRQVWQMSIASSAGLGYYTKMNQFIVKTVSIMAYRGSEGTIEAGLLAYLGFMYMKEKAGNERAVGTLGFSNNMWPDVTSWQKFISLVAIQNNAYLYFEQFGSEEARKLHERLEDSKVARVVLRWQGFALANKTEYNSHRSELSMKNVDAADWFDNTTFRINQFRSVETLIATELNSFFDDVDNETEDFILGILLSISSLALLTIWVAIKGVRLILRSNAIGSYGNINKKKKRRKRKKKTSAEVADQ